MAEILCFMKLVRMSNKIMRCEAYHIKVTRYVVSQVNTSITIEQRSNVIVMSNNKCGIT